MVTSLYIFTLIKSGKTVILILMRNSIFLSVGFLLILLSYCFTIPIDPDFGWHLRYGEQLVKTGTIATVDTFTHTFSGQPVIDTEWIVNGAYYFLYQHTTFIGLSFFFALITSLAYLIPLFISKDTMYSKMIVGSWSILGSAPVLAIGPRPQAISLVFYSLVVIILLSFRKRKNIFLLFSLPFLFLLWANMHPGYMVGIVILAAFLATECLFLIVDSISRKKQNFPQIGKRILLFSFVLLMCFGVTNIKPHGKETLGGLSIKALSALFLPVNFVLDTPTGQVRTSISEWLPPVLHDLSGTLFFIGILFSILLFTNRPLRRVDIANLILILISIYFATLSRRNVPYFFLTFLCVGIPYLSELFQKRRNEPVRKILVIVFIFLVVIRAETLISTLKQFYRHGSDLSAYCTELSTPCGALAYIKENKPQGRMLNYYTWGGYLIWNLPEYPVFIDGRIPGGKIYEDFDSISRLSSKYESLLDTYKISWILLPKNQKFENILTKDTAWETAYSDDLSVVLIRNTNKNPL